MYTPVRTLTEVRDLLNAFAFDGLARGAAAGTRRRCAETSMQHFPHDFKDVRRAAHGRSARSRLPQRVDTTC